jgi:hypothetical protein
MSLGPVGSSSSLVALLKAELASDTRRRTTGKAGAASSSRSEAGAARPSLRPQLIEAVKNIDRTNPDAVKQARRRIIRAVLVWQFGPDLREHSQWAAMLDAIATTLEQDAGHLAQFDALLAELQQSG